MGHWLTPEQAGQYSHLTSEALALALSAITHPDGDAGQQANGLYAAGLAFAGLPAALALVMEMPGGRLEVLSLVVAEPFRRLGLARQLLQWLTNETKRMGKLVLSVSYPLDHACTASMDRLTHPQRGWSRALGLRLVNLDRPGWQILASRLAPLNSHLRRNGRFEVVPWQNLSSVQDQELKHKAKQCAPQWARPSLGEPDRVMSQRDDAVSQVLLDQGQVKGWLIADRVGVSLLRMTQWWVDPSLQGRGAALLLVLQAIRNAFEAEPAYASCSFAVSATTSPEMLRLCSRHLEPLASQVTVNKRAEIKC